MDSTDFFKNHPQTYDAILLLDLLEHIPVESQINFMHHVFAVLKPGGRAILTVPNASAILASRHRYIDYTHYCSFTEYSLSFVLQNAGFQKVSIPGQGPLQRPSLRIWHQEVRNAWFSFLVKAFWRRLIEMQYAPPSIDDICLELNLTAVAYKN